MISAAKLDTGALLLSPRSGCRIPMLPPYREKTLSTWIWMQGSLCPSAVQGTHYSTILRSTRSASENLILASTAARGVPCRHGNTACIPARGVGTDPSEAQAYIQALEACLETLASMVHALQEQVHTLQEQLNQTSQNSSRPPSSDPPQHGRPRRPRSHRRRGGQPGHPGHTRTLIPVEDVNGIEVMSAPRRQEMQLKLLVPVGQRRRELMGSVDATAIDDHDHLFTDAAEEGHQLMNILMKPLRIKLENDLIEPTLSNP